MPINAMFRKILRVWCDFLSSPESLYVLNDSPRGWKCASARKSTRIEQYQHRPREKHWGFTSWNDYFTRRFKPGDRPIADPDDDKVIVNACESTPYALKTNVKRHDRFWVKAQPYSLQDMLANDESVGAVRRRDRVPGVPRRAQLSPLAQPGDGHDPQGVRPGGDLLLGGRVGGRGPRGPEPVPGLPRARRDAGDHPHRERRSRDRPDVPDARRHGRGLLLRHPSRDPARPPGEEGRGSRVLPVRRFDLLPDLPPGAIAGFAVDALPQPDNPTPPLVLLGTKIATAN